MIPTTPAIILPTKNRHHLLKRSIEDVLNQSCTDFHLLVVDHDSGDATRDVVERFRDPRVHYIHHVGYHDAAWSPKNAALENLPADTLGVLFRDDDDLYASTESLGYLVETALSLGPRFGIVTGDYVEVDAAGDVIAVVTGDKTSTTEIASAARFPVKAAIFSRQLVDEVGILPPIRSRETILWAYLMVNLLEQNIYELDLCYTGRSITRKARHDDAISVQNLANGSRHASEALIRNIHYALHPEQRTGVGVAAS